MLLPRRRHPARAPAPLPAVLEAAGCRQRRWSPAASRSIPEHPGGGRAAPGLGSARRGRAVIHRLKNALRLATYDTGEARGERGSGSGERPSASCELLCLRAKSCLSPPSEPGTGGCGQDEGLPLGLPALPGAPAHLRAAMPIWPSDCAFPRLLCTPHPQWGYGRELHGESGELDPSLVPAPLPLPSQGFILGNLEGPTSGRERCQRPGSSPHSRGCHRLCPHQQADRVLRIKPFDTSIHCLKLDMTKTGITKSLPQPNHHLKSTAQV